MARDWNAVANLFIQICADCIPVKGASKSAIYDLTRGELFTFPTTYYGLLQELRYARVEDVLVNIRDHEEGEQIAQFLNFLDENDFLLIVADPSEFPPLEEKWDFPGLIQNAIIDVATQLHDFSRLLADLSSLGCQHLQVRAFTDLLTLEQCSLLLAKVRNTSIVGVELLLRYDGSTDEQYGELVRCHPVITAFTVHSALQSRLLEVDHIHPSMQASYPLREVRFVRQEIVSANHCGQITPEYLTLPSVSSFFEAKTFNGCLNRKICVDAQGEIRNCPSMSESFGNAQQTTLSEVARLSAFQSKWAFAKDHISICKDCEFRYACSDCRAYLESPRDQLSKPLKCGYDPYSGEWQDWKVNPSKVVTAAFYGIDLLEK